MNSSKNDIVYSPPVNCWGWQNIEEAANDVFCSIHSSLLKGNYVFGYKNTYSTDKSPLNQVVVVRFDKDIFGVGVVTSGYTMLLPQVPLIYLERELVEDMNKWKVEKKIIETFKQIIEDIKNETTSN